MKNIFLIIAILPILSCIHKPEPVSRYTVSSTNSDSYWYRGRNFNTITSDQLKVTVAFNEVQNGLIVLDVGVVNNSQDTILVSHELFRAKYSIKEPIYEKQTPQMPGNYQLKQTGKFLNKTITKMPIDPEQKLIYIDREISGEVARYKSQSLVTSLFRLLDTTASVMADDYEYDEEEELDREISDHNRKQSHERKISNLNSNHNQWRYGSLRKTTLPPSTGISGKVYFKLSEYCEEFEFSLAGANSQNIIYKLEQY